MYETIPEFLSSVSKKYSANYSFYIRRFLRTTRFTYSEMVGLSFKTAAHLLSNGLSPGDKVLIWAPNMPEWVLALLGSLSAGIVVVPVGLHSTFETACKYIEQTKPKVLFLSKFYPIDFKKEDHKKIKTIYLEDLVDLVKDIEIKKLPEVHKSALAEIVFTSGTTGEPKGVMISHHNILFQIEVLLKTIPKYKHYRLLSVLPLSHVMEQIVGLFGPLSRGGTIYYLPRINAVTIKKALKKYQITDLGVVPQMMRMFLDSLEYEVSQKKKEGVFRLMMGISKFLPIGLRRVVFKNIQDNFGGKLYVFGVGSAPLDIKLANDWEAMGIKVVEGYGASETTGGVTVNRIDERKIGSVGKKIPGIELKLSTEGEILVKGDSVTKGYFENEEKTKLSFTSDGYFKTGDVGYFDKEGRLYITGREKFKIVTAAGDKVYPEDIERKLNAHPEVWDSCVFGVKKDDGEIVHAEVILKPGAKNKLEDIIKKVNGDLEPNQQIFDFSVWPEKDFPRLHTLKVDRNLVKSVALNRSSNEEIPLEKKDYDDDELVRIIAKVSKVSQDKIRENTKLTTELRIDSLKRIELVSLIEEEMGIELNEESIGADTTISSLRKNINTFTKEKLPYDFNKISSFIRNVFNKKLKVYIQKYIVFAALRFFINVNINTEVATNKFPKQAIYVGNHPNPPIDVILMLSCLPRKIRENLVAPSNDWVWNDSKYFILAYITQLIGGAFPINIHGKSIRGSLETMMDFIDDGYGIYLMPEGNTSPVGVKLGELKPGLGYLFSNTAIPIIPFYISGEIFKTFPRQTGEKDVFQHHIPHGFSKVKIKFGEPFTMNNSNAEESMGIIKQKILDLSD